MAERQDTSAAAAQLVAPRSKAPSSVARMAQYWYVACESSELARGAVLPATVLGIPLVLFRGSSGVVGALLDRCPHRNVPLSVGRVERNCLECAYHGWQFSPSGECTEIPGLLASNERAANSALAYPVREQQGFVWVYTDAEHAPATDPYVLPHWGDSSFTHARRQARANGSLLATVENALDVPHTSFLHKGLFRGRGSRNTITAVVRRWPNRCEAEYLGEPRPQGLVGRVLAPRGGEVEHFDRFFLPSVAQVDYRLGGDTHICITSLCTPVSDFDTKLYAVVSYRVGNVPGWLLKPFLEPVGRLIFSQDARILKLQSETIARFGGEQFASTEIDLLGPQIWRLMKAGAKGAIAPGGDLEIERSVDLSV